MTEDGMPRELISREVLDRRVGELAAEIERDYADSEELLCVGVLKGSVFFMSDLLQRLSRPLVVDFFQTSSYRGETTSPGEVRIRRDLDHSLAGRDVLLIEDIVDTGYTMRTIMALMGFRGARSVRLCVLLDKACKRETPVQIHYRGSRWTTCSSSATASTTTTATATCPTSACWRKSREPRSRLSLLGLKASPWGSSGT